MVDIKIEQISSLEKVFLDFAGAQRQEKLLACGGEVVSYQIAYTANLEGGYRKIDAEYRIESPLAECIHAYKVANVPSELPAYPDQNDAYYITTKPGLFPGSAVSNRGWRTGYHAWVMACFMDRSQCAGRLSCRRVSCNGLD